jgi:hypothetical protein
MFILFTIGYLRSAQNHSVRKSVWCLANTFRTFYKAFAIATLCFRFNSVLTVLQPVAIRLYGVAVKPLSIDTESSLLRH